MSPTITFGPPGQEWHYSRADKTYDLAGGSTETWTFAATEGPQGTWVTIDRETTALVVVDMQNLFLDPKCTIHPLGIEAVKPTIKVIEKCRQSGIQVIWLNWGLTEEDMKVMPASVQRGWLRETIQSMPTDAQPYKGLGYDLGESKGRCLFAGSWNAQIYPPLQAHVQPHDLHCAKNRMSGLWTPKQPLYKTLQAEGIKTILFAGVNTDQCVLGTFVDAYNSGWNCILVDDCCGTTTENGKDVTFFNIAASYGFVTDSESLLAAKAG